MTSSTIYWITRLDYFRELCEAIDVMCFISFAILGLITIIFCENSELHKNDDELMRRTLKKILGIAISVTLVLCASYTTKAFIPTTKEMCTIQIIPAVANSEEMGKLKDMGSDVLTLASDWLREQVEQRKAK